MITFHNGNGYGGRFGELNKIIHSQLMGLFNHEGFHSSALTGILWDDKEKNECTVFTV